MSLHQNADYLCKTIQVNSYLMLCNLGKISDIKELKCLESQFKIGQGTALESEWIFRFRNDYKYEVHCQKRLEIYFRSKELVSFTLQVTVPSETDKYPIADEFQNISENKFPLFIHFSWSKISSIVKDSLLIVFKVYPMKYNVDKVETTSHYYYNTDDIEKLREDIAR